MPQTRNPVQRIDGVDVHIQGRGAQAIIMLHGWPDTHRLWDETMAHLQHFGGPTRLLDVTVNPLIALWFAVESRKDDDGTDARLLAFVASSPVHLNRNWHGYHLHWHELDSRSKRVRAKWGTGLGRRLWMPPAFNSRISSQNAGFLIDGVVVIPTHLIDQTIQLASVKVTGENNSRAELEKGAYLRDVYKKFGVL